MTHIILPDGKKYYYRLKPLFPGIKQIDRTIAGDNLVLLKNILASHHIMFQLAAGTVLGAVRENDFIEHDEDIDLAFKESDRHKVLSLLPILRENGFELCRYDRRDLFSLMRNGEYIDLYFFHKYNDVLSVCSGWIVKTEHLEHSIDFPLHGEIYPIPLNYEDYLIGLYGQDWRIPIKYLNFERGKWEIILYSIKEHLKMRMPKSVFNIFARSAETKLINQTLGKLQREGIV